MLYEIYCRSQKCCKMKVHLENADFLSKSISIQPRTGLEKVEEPAPAMVIALTLQAGPMTQHPNSWQTCVTVDQPSNVDMPPLSSLLVRIQRGFATSPVEQSRCNRTSSLREPYPSVQLLRVKDVLPVSEILRSFYG